MRRIRRTAPGTPGRTRLTTVLGREGSWGARITRLAADLRRRAAPNHWSTLFGVISLACVVVLFVTGAFLMVFYDPSSDTVVYQGSYPLLRGVEMSKALESTLYISFEVRGGLLMRQAHHWAALLLPASLIMQVLSRFFTGAFRRPRRAGWVLLVAIFLVTLLGGWSGYALPDDMLSGTGLRIAQGVALGIPVVGTWLSALLFGGEFPGEVFAQLYPMHIVIVPLALVVLLVLRWLLESVSKPPQFPGPGRAEDNVVGIPLWPAATARATGLFFITVGVLVLMGGTMTISPVWRYGPSSSGAATAGSQPDWYTAFLDGALRLVPKGWEFVWSGQTWTLAVLVPLAAVALFFAVLVSYPFIEELITGDRSEHHLLDRPRQAPARTGLGVAGIVFYGVLWAAGSADLIATQFGVSFELVIGVFQCLVLVGPPVGFLLARRLCLGLQAADRQLLRHGAESGVIVQTPSGGFVETHQALGPSRRARIAPRELEPSSTGAQTGPSDGAR